MTTRIVTVRPIDGGSFRDVLDLEVTAEQGAWVAPVSRYLALCAYGGVWHPLGLYAGDEAVGFAMWAFDADEGSHWIGGFLVDRRRQGLGYGRAAIEALIAWLATEQGATELALSYHPDNTVAERLYASVGFAATGEKSEGETVARRPA